MTERELLDLWNKARLHIIVSQIAPTFLLIATVALLGAGLGHAPLAARIATLGILLASGILGALAQFTAASDGIAAAEQLDALDGVGPAATSAIRQAPLLVVVKWITPSIFTIIFIALFFALIAG
jgi:hypothetical protein